MWAGSGATVVRLALTPDLALSPLALSDTTPDEGQAVTLSVVAYANNVTSTNVTVQFFLGDPSFGGVADRQRSRHRLGGARQFGHDDGLLEPAR